MERLSIIRHLIVITSIGSHHAPIWLLCKGTSPQELETRWRVHQIIVRRWISYCFCMRRLMPCGRMGRSARKCQIYPRGLAVGRTLRWSRHIDVYLPRKGEWNTIERVRDSSWVIGIAHKYKSTPLFSFARCLMALSALNTCGSTNMWEPHACRIIMLARYHCRECINLAQKNRTPCNHQRTRKEGTAKKEIIDFPIQTGMSNQPSRKKQYPMLRVRPAFTSRPQLPSCPKGEGVHTQPATSSLPN